MQTIAHRGAMTPGLQNSPAGVRVAAAQGADFVELDVLAKPAMGTNADSPITFLCAHGLSQSSHLTDCLSQIPSSMSLILHLKGHYNDSELALLARETTRFLPICRVLFASHRPALLKRLHTLLPEVGLACFGLLPSLTALVKRHPWRYCLINQAVLTRPHVRALQKQGYSVFASCVYEIRSRESIQRLGVDATFINLRS